MALSLTHLGPFSQLTPTPTATATHTLSFSPFGSDPLSLTEFHISPPLVKNFTLRIHCAWLCAVQGHLHASTLDVERILCIFVPFFGALLKTLLTASDTALTQCPVTNGWLCSSYSPPTTPPPPPLAACSLLVGKVMPAPHPYQGVFTRSPHSSESPDAVRNFRINRWA